MTSQGAPPRAEGSVPSASAGPKVLPAPMLAALLLVLIPLVAFPTLVDSASGLVLNDFVRHFEPAFYDRKELSTQHKRLKRDATTSSSSASSSSPAPPHLKIHFTAHNRVFKMHLRPDRSLMTEDVLIEGSGGRRLDFDPTTSVYSGSLEDDETAMVEGMVTSEGLFDGTITLSDGQQFYIEPSSRYFKLREKRETSKEEGEGDNVTSPSGFHSVIYRSSDVVSPNLPTACPSHLLHLRRMEEGTTMERKGAWQGEEDEGSYTPVHKGVWKRFAAVQNGSSSERLPRREERPSWFGARGPHQGRRKKRWATGGAIDPRKTTCMLYLQADHLFFQKFGSEEACIEVMTRHVQRVNSIYRATDFNQDGKPDDISFMIKRIKVHSTDALNDPSYRFPNNYGVEKFLELFSEEDYDPFCLAYMFTYRDFEMGTLGLAWTGDLKNAGGVCEKNGHYRGSMKSLNTGIVTLLNYGKHVPPAVSHVTLAHEIGHNFGSPHDPELCTPGGEDGNYIMFARATSGDKKNNNKFSPCSLKSIDPVLNAKARNVKGCFTEPQAALCGNGVVEAGEECDCGWEEDCRDTCCFPMRTYPPPDEPPCRLTPRSVCSPSQGPCCTTNCQLRFGDKCRDDNGCRDSSYCNGRGPHCPLSTNKPNKTICNDEFVCFMGECTGSICLAYGLESCQCLPSPKDPPTKACELCCKMPGDDSPCLSSFDWNISPYDIPDMFAKPGTPCNDYNGYCDVFQKCREVDPSGPLATLRKLLLSDESIATFKRWVIDHWYAVLFIFAAIVVLTVALTRLLAKRPESKKLKSVTIIHSSTTETVRLPPGEGGGGGSISRGRGGRSDGAPSSGADKTAPEEEGARDGREGTKGAEKGGGIVLVIEPQEAKGGGEGEEKGDGGGGGGGDKAGAGHKQIVGAAEGGAVEGGDGGGEGEAQRGKPKKEREELAASGAGEEKKKGKGRRGRRGRKVIDYSAMQGDEDVDKLGGVRKANKEVEDSMGKVQNWLLFASNHFPKSKSTPAGLVTVSEDKVAPKDVTLPLPRPNKGESKARSLGNLRPIRDGGSGGDQRVRLQVVYKPPFKFSLKLRRAEKKPPEGVDATTAHEAERQSKNVASRRRSGGVAEGSGGRTAVMLRVAEGNKEKQKAGGKGGSGERRKSSLAEGGKRRQSTGVGLPGARGGGEVLEEKGVRRKAKAVAPRGKGGGEERRAAMRKRDAMDRVASADTEVLLSESEYLFAEDEAPSKVDT
ncbi:disintegrin and metalloproteinase domain-containing protein 10 [Hetaerina americana]|uniref:disintegrin and metalloproteinase domain-containing protein 10 n=1 Tax=Hetaerina americana TaxID=62018 RepID=UPI003A7F1140